MRDPYDIKGNAERSRRQRIAVKLVMSGQATVSEAARLAGIDRQRLHAAVKAMPIPYEPTPFDKRYVGKLVQSRPGGRWHIYKCERTHRADEISGYRRDYLARLWAKAGTGRKSV